MYIYKENRKERKQGVSAPSQRKKTSKFDCNFEVIVYFSLKQRGHNACYMRKHPLSKFLIVKGDGAT